LHARVAWGRVLLAGAGDGNRTRTLPFSERRIFVTLRLSPPAVAVRALDYAFTLALPL